jgi:very-long-chain (3R)-3-hydroxyacyl-CoA dehydratase
MGISSEMWLVYKSIGPAGKRDERLPYVLYGILGLYVPGKFLPYFSSPNSPPQSMSMLTNVSFAGAYILYTHMMAQRRKVLRAAGKQKAR